MRRARCAAGIAIAVAGIAATWPASRAGDERPSLESRLETTRSTASLPAVAGAVFRSNELLEMAAVGVRKLGDATPVTEGDLWHIGSITKSFTATLVGRFVERGVLEWDSTLGDLIGAERAGAYAPVRLTDLLSHRAGFPADVPRGLAIKAAWSGASQIEQRERLLDALLAATPTSEPGEAYLYSNAGYIVVGAVLEARTKRSWEDLVREEVLLPLDLESAGFGPPGSPDEVTEPWGHRRQADGTLFPMAPGPLADNPAFLGPAGTLHLSVADLVRWGQEHLRGERGRDGLLTTASFRRLHRPPAEGADYAFGWVVRAAEGRRVVWHNGSNTFWYAVVGFDPDEDLGVVLVTNGGIGAARAIDDTFTRLIRDRTRGPSADSQPEPADRP